MKNQMFKRLVSLLLAALIAAAALLSFAGCVGNGEDGRGTQASADGTDGAETQQSGDGEQTSGEGIDLPMLTPKS